ncbi:hypothetical protein JYU34_018802 [Plutella xylostella]|uniref:FP protein C-terminal domain-containing protein n=1 Tax=Plutella xylostella TaxID=51655 RepID=A0ABQ7PZB5_PLUXY|nr:hypothetical protein JYU34_018802 [Plutella xylostella]
MRDILETNQQNSFKKFETALNNIQKTTTEIEKSLNCLTVEHEEIKLQMDNMEKECKDNHSYILILEDKIEDLQRDSRNTSIEIKNVPLKQNETNQDLTQLVLNLAKHVNVGLNPADVRNVYRVHGKREGNKQIIVELSSTPLKKSMLTGVKSYNNRNKGNKLNASHLGLKDCSTPVYMAEYLTPKANRLYFLARDLTKTNAFRFCWTSNGRIFVRKEECAPAILIRSEHQIQSLKNGK